jgi:hypothetical protein
MRRSSVAAKWSFAAISAVLLRAHFPHEPSSNLPLAIALSLLLQHLIALFRTPQFAIRLHSVSVPNTFGDALANAKGMGVKTRDQATVVMNALLQITKLQYAVIRLSSITDPPQRLILAYRDERTLRALIAGPSIVGLGFGSREEAMSTENPALEKAVAPAPANELESARSGQHQPYCRGGRAAAWSSFASLGRLASGIVQFAFAATIYIFYSKNIVSAIIRSVLAGSV